jgi:hypothetical protein
MSLDLYYSTDVCTKCGRGEEVAHVNVTYNLSQMWREAIPEDDRLIPIDGMTGKKALPKLEKALLILTSDPEHFRKFNPENGWGTYEILVQAVRKCIAACRAGSGKWETWR